MAHVHVNQLDHHQAHSSWMSVWQTTVLRTDREKQPATKSEAYSTIRRSALGRHSTPCQRDDLRTPEVQHARTQGRFLAITSTHVLRKFKQVASTSTIAGQNCSTLACAGLFCGAHILDSLCHVLRTLPKCHLRLDTHGNIQVIHEILKKTTGCVRGGALKITKSCESEIKGGQGEKTRSQARRVACMQRSVSMSTSLGCCKG